MSDCIDNLQSQIDELKSGSASRGRRASSVSGSRGRSSSSSRMERKAEKKLSSRSASSAN